VILDKETTTVTPSPSPSPTITLTPYFPPLPTPTPAPVIIDQPEVIVPDQPAPDSAALDVATATPTRTPTPTLIPTATRPPCSTWTNRRINADAEEPSDPGIGYWTKGQYLTASQTGYGREGRRSDDGALGLQLEGAYYIREITVKWGGQRYVFEPDYSEFVLLQAGSAVWRIKYNYLDEDGDYSGAKGHARAYGGVPTTPISLITFSRDGLYNNRIDIEYIYIDYCSTIAPIPLTSTPTPTPVPDITDLQIPFNRSNYTELTLNECTANYPLGEPLPSDPTSGDRAKCYIHVTLRELIDGRLNGVPPTHLELIRILVESEYRAFIRVFPTNQQDWPDEAIARRLYDTCGTNGCSELELYYFLAYYSAARNAALDFYYDRIQSIEADAAAGSSYWQTEVNNLNAAAQRILSPPTGETWTNGLETSTQPYGFATRTGLTDEDSVTLVSQLQYCNEERFALRYQDATGTYSVFFGTTLATDRQTITLPDDRQVTCSF